MRSLVPFNFPMHPSFFGERKPWPRAIRALLVFVLVGYSGLSSGCGRVEYSPNQLHAVSLSSDHFDEAVQTSKEVSSVVEELFGGLDSPKVPEPMSTIVDVEKVARAAGPVGRAVDKIERGLFRKHCVQCHGLSGDGTGPSALLLAPYPRDFRRGTFKFKSTPYGQKPTHEDIEATLRRGIAGTAMPAFETLNRSKEFAEDVDALVHYVKFLSMRGEVERKLIRHVVIDEVSKLTKEDAEVGTAVQQVAESWQLADSKAIRPRLVRE